MIGLVLFGLCIYFAVGVLWGLCLILQALGIGLLWWLAPSNAFKHLCNQGPPDKKPPRLPGMPPPIPPAAKRDKHGIPYL